MRKALWVAAFCLWATTAHAQTRAQYKYHGVANPWATDAQETITPTSGVTSGNTVVLFFTANASNRSVTSVQDNNAVSLPLVTSCEISGDREMWAYAYIAGSGVTSFTVTLSSAIASGGELFLWELSGAHAVDSIGNASCQCQRVGDCATQDADHDSGTVTITGSAAVMVGGTFGSTGSYTIDADYTQETNNSLLVTGYRSVTASDTMTNTSLANELSLTALVEVLPAAGGGSSPPMMNLLGVDR